MIAEKKAVDTFVNVVKRIGVAQVRQVVEAENLVFCKVPVRPMKSAPNLSKKIFREKNVTTVINR